MLGYLKNIDQLINNLLLGMGIYGPILGCFLILVESIFPFLPLFVFITINFLVFGNIIGFFISWIFTVLGCLISFLLCRNKIKIWFNKKMENKKKIKKIMKIVNTMKVEQLTLLIAIPFTPAFMVNIAAGLSNMPIKKYMISLIIGKIFLVIFWGFIGTSLLQSLTHPTALIKIIILVSIAYVISKIISKKFHLN